MPQPPSYPEPSSTELTVLNLLRDRRDSRDSATSSAYLSSSRRSSGISPCFSSRRSSQASQSENAQYRHLHNLSTTDSYDPISTDASRRSSEASQCGGGVSGAATLGGNWCCGSLGGGGAFGSKGVLNLTPAQHYHLKARYAAATGGPPPTPLPNMEQVRTKILGNLNGQKENQITLPPLVKPRRCSDGSAHGQNGHTGYRHEVYYPGENPGISDRRASDPVRARVSHVMPQIQRFNSLNNMQPLPPVGNHLPHGLNLQNCSRSEGNIQNNLLSPCPPSILEQSALETLAMEHDGTQHLRIGDYLAQYLLQSEDNQSLPIQHGRSARSYRNDAPPPPNLQHNTQDGHSPRNDGLPIQWNEVTSGSADVSPPRPGQSNSTGHPFGHFENMAVVQQLPLDFICNGTRQELSSRMNLGVNGGTTTGGHKPSERGTSSTYFGQSNLHIVSNLRQTNSPQDQTSSCWLSDSSRFPRRSQSTTAQLYSTSQTSNVHNGILSSRDVNGTSCSLANQVSGLKIEVEDQLPCSSSIQQEQFLLSNPEFCQIQSHPSEDILSPGANMVTSTADDNVLENVGLDFSSILDENFDQGSLTSDVGLSHVSSRLMTPHRSNMFQNLPPGTGNMAIGDMSSLLTTLAEENKFLAIMQ